VDKEGGENMSEQKETVPAGTGDGKYELEKCLARIYSLIAARRELAVKVRTANDSNLLNSYVKLDEAFTESIKNEAKHLLGQKSEVKTIIQQNETATNGNNEEKVMNSIIEVLRANNLTFNEARGILYSTGLELDKLRFTKRFNPFLASRRLLIISGLVGIPKIMMVIFSLVPGAILSQYSNMQNN
jgi:DNA primase catalytic subunit